MMPKIIPIAMSPEDSVRQWKLIETWVYQFDDITISVPKNFIFDGASIPRIFRRIYSPTGYLFLAALVHDFCYQRGYFYWVDHKKRPNKRKVTRFSADQTFKHIAKIEYPNHGIKTWVAYTALRIGGWVARNKHRKSVKKL